MNAIHSTALIPKASIEELCGHRDRAMELFGRAIDTATASNAAAKLAAPSMPYVGGAHLAISGSNPRDADLKAWRRSIDRDCWRHLLQATGLGAIMGAKQRREFDLLIEKDPPEFTVATAYSTFAAKVSAAGEIFEESIVNAFLQAPAGFVSNDSFHLGTRMILDYAVSTFPYLVGWAHSSYGQTKRDVVRDLDRIMHILDHRSHDTDATDLVAQAMREQEHGGTVETVYFRFRWFRKGTMHVWFLRPDLVREMNRIIARRLGATIADAS